MSNLLEHMIWGWRYLIVFVDIGRTQACLSRAYCEKSYCSIYYYLNILNGLLSI